MTGIKVEYVPKCLYHYDICINNSSIVRKRNISHIHSAVRFIEELEPLLSEQRYKRGWFKRKAYIKKWIFQLNTKVFDLKNTYKEINSEYILRFIGARKGSVEYCVALYLNGYSKWICRSLFNSRRFASKIIHIIRRK